MQTAFDVARFCQRFLSDGHNGLLGLRYLSHSPGVVELELPYAAAMAADAAGSTADGAVMTALDMAGTLAVWSRVGAFRPHATIDMRIDHLSASTGAAIIARAECHHLDDALARVTGVARTADGEVARFAAAYMFTDPR